MLDMIGFPLSRPYPASDWPSAANTSPPSSAPGEQNQVFHRGESVSILAKSGVNPLPLPRLRIAAGWIAGARDARAYLFAIAAWHVFTVTVFTGRARIQALRADSVAVARRQPAMRFWAYLFYYLLNNYSIIAYHNNQ
jgi:hypothetical protein